MVLCFVPGCNHRSLKDTCKFRRFPFDEKKSTQWQKLCRREDRAPTYNDRVCTCHFAGEPSPSVFPWTADPAQVLAPTKRKMARPALGKVQQTTGVENPASKGRPLHAAASQGTVKVFPDPKPKRYVPRYYRQEMPKSFWTPALDDRTKHTMRQNSLVVGFVWKTDPDGTVFLSGTKVVRSKPPQTKPAEQRFPEEVLRNFVFKVKQDEDADEKSSSKQDVLNSRKHSSQPDRAVNHVIHSRETTSQSNRVANHVMRSRETTGQPNRVAGDRLSVTSDRLLTNPTRVLEIAPIEDLQAEESAAAKLNSTNKRISSKRRRDPVLTPARYALYRYFILRCRSMYHLYYSKNKDLHRNQRATAGSPAVTAHTLRVTHALSSHMARLRTRLKVCESRSRASRDQQLLDMLADDSDDSYDDDEEEDDNSMDSLISESKLPAPISHRLSQARRRLDSSDSDGDVDTALRSADTWHGRRKTLKVKRQREKLRQEQEEWGFEDEGEKEATRQRSQMRARRYQFLKSAKQSKLHLEDRGIMDSTTSPIPQVISIESLSGNQLHALSWEVPASDDPDTSEFFTKHSFHS